MSNIPKLKINAEMTSNKIISDDMKKTNGTVYITKEMCDGLYKSKNNGEVNVKSINYIPAQEQKIQFSLTEPYTIRFAGWFMVNPDDMAAESWYISINDRPMFHSDDDGNMSVSIVVYEGDVITSTTEYDRYGYLMPCESELSDWRDSSLKSDTVDIWKNAVRTDGTVADQWLENNNSSSWNATHASTYSDTLSYIENNEAFDVSGNHLFYIQTENIRNGYCMFSTSSLQSFSGDLSSLTDGEGMFDNCYSLTSFSSDLSNLNFGNWMFAFSSLQSFNGDLSSLTDGTMMFAYSALESFNGDLSSLTNGEGMFNATYLTSFNGDLSSLTNGELMFLGCKLDLASVQNIANTIKTVSSGSLTLGIQSSLQGNADLTTALNAIESKGWGVHAEYN